ncbi:MAG TPA: hypothetical protein VGH92_12615 [Gaiellaceae bacterium]|jgi:hypothetical protein
MKALLLIATVVAAITTAAPAFGDTFITDTLAPGGGHSSPYDTQQGTTFITDTLAPGGGTSTPVVTIPSSSAFSWSDAGVGAGAATGVLVALLGATLVVGRRRNERLAI